MPIGILVISIIGSRILTTIFVAKIVEKALYRSLNHPEENFPIAPPLYNIVNISVVRSVLIPFEINKNGINVSVAVRIIESINPAAMSTTNCESITGGKFDVLVLVGVCLSFALLGDLDIDKLINKLPITTIIPVIPTNNRHFCHPKETTNIATIIGAIIFPRSPEKFNIPIEVNSDFVSEPLETNLAPTGC